ncbi:MAG: hypothetical protein JRI68_26220, partial [Deltaproteobacteria bacterium]|nr:hypothetical protein [Deltaproteobacteria bacterium]
MGWPGHWFPGGFLAATAFCLGCGARSELEIDPLCEVEGGTRPCESICGQGVETCIEGRWRDCDAPLPADQIALEGTVRDFHAA